MFNNEQIEELRNYFHNKPEYGAKLPNPKDVPDWTIFFLKVGLAYIEHIMFNNKWHKKVIDSNSNVTLEEVWAGQE